MEMVDQNLQLTRLAAAVLNQLAVELNLGNLAHRFQGDDVNAWVIMSPIYVKALVDHHVAAELQFDPPQVEILVPELNLLVRRDRLDDFDPANHGLDYNETRDWRGQKAPDILADWIIPDTLEVPKGPRAFIPQRPRERPVHVKRAMD